MASPLVTFLENYHWKGYTVDTIVNNSNIYYDVFASWKLPHAPVLQEHGNWVCALQSPRSMGMGSHGKVEHTMG